MYLCVAVVGNTLPNGDRPKYRHLPRFISLRWKLNKNQMSVLVSKHCIIRQSGSPVGVRDDSTVDIHPRQQIVGRLIDFGMNVHPSRVLFKYFSNGKDASDVEFMTVLVGISEQYFLTRIHFMNIAFIHHQLCMNVAVVQNFKQGRSSVSVPAANDRYVLDKPVDRCANRT